MAKIKIDDVEYELDDLSQEAKAQLGSMQFCDAELQRLQAESITLQTARAAYGAALKAELEKMKTAPKAAKSEEKEKKPKKKFGLF